VIRINKPARATAILRKRGVHETQRLCTAYNVCPGTDSESSFEHRIYGAKSVKTALRKAQNGKCAFCESKRPW